VLLGYWQARPMEADWVLIMVKKKIQPLKSLPMATGVVSEELGITISKEFIIRKLKIKPYLSAKNCAYWDDINLIKARLGEYFTKAAKL
jgi:hypothetical protein